MTGRSHVVNHLSVPAACFTHPEISFVGLSQEKAEESAVEHGFKLGISKTSFKGNTKVRTLSAAEVSGLCIGLYVLPAVT